ncbi:MAG: leucine-rich repeat domain-containing protein [Mogibacterium sp.]|nr:leucine-rich repeat domain-containing protein [Mogibacterium sp.]
MSVIVDGDRLIRYEDAAVHYVVPQHVRYIEDLAFSGADHLAVLEIPDSVDHIGNYAFRMCYSLEEIKLPQKVAEAGAGLFQHCWKLKKISLPEGILMIGGEMFESCHALQTLEIPDSVEKIDRTAFSGCRNLRDIVISPAKLRMLPPAARYAAVLTYMERRAENADDASLNETEMTGRMIIDDFARERQGNLLDLAINRRNAEAVRYMLKRGLIEADALADYLEKSAERNRVEITALMLEYGQKKDNRRDLFDEDPFR